MSELMVQENGVATNRVSVSIGKHGLEPTDFDQLWRCANIIARSGMAPKSLETPEKIFVAACHGKEIGLSLMQSLQNIAVINGKPGIFGDCAKALVESSATCEYVEEKTVGTGDAMKAVCVAKRKGRKSETVQEFSVEDAKAAGLWKKAGPWTNYPKRMLQMRARGFCLRDAFPDVLGGLRTVEELQDFPDGEAQLDRKLTSGDTIAADDLDIVEQELLTGETPVAEPVKEKPKQSPLIQLATLDDFQQTISEMTDPVSVEASRVLFTNADGVDFPTIMEINKLAEKRLAQAKKEKAKVKV